MKWLYEKKHEKFMTDWAWSIAALIMMNTVLQLVLYPILRAKLGIDGYGNALYLIGIVNIIGTSVGCGMNNSCLKRSVYGRTNADTYNIILFMACIVFIPIAFVVIYFNSGGIDLTDIVMYWLLICLTTCRNYADVEFRLNTDYKGYFKYYLGVTTGYGIGIIAFWVTDEWKLMLLLGEAVSLVNLLINRNKNNQTGECIGEKFNVIFYSIAALVLSQLMVNFVLNADRLILKVFVSSAAVSIYFVASLLGKTIALITTPLNSVIIGHLAKKKTNMSRNTFWKIVAVIFVAALGVLGICVIGSHVFVYIFYQDDYEMVKEFFIIANAGSIFYFMTGIVNTILLRYINEVFQIIINGVYCLLFVLITIPLTVKFGIWGFSSGILLVNILRYILAIAVGSYYLDGENRKSER